VLDWGQLRLVVAAEVVLLLWLGHQAVAAAAAVPYACRVYTSADGDLSCHHIAVCDSLLQG
jgi:hypothetical protein